MRSTSRFLPLFAATAVFLPLSGFADPQLSTSLEVQSCWENSTITDGQCQDYKNSQTAPPGTSLSDSGSNAEAPWGNAAGSVQVFYGSCHMEGSGAALESQNDGILGSAGDNASANWNSQMTINSAGLDGQPATVRITFNASGDAAGNASSYLAGSGVSYGYYVGDGQNSAGYAGSWDPTNGWNSGGPPGRTFTFDATCTVGQPCEIAHQVTFSVSAGTGEPDFGDPMDCNAQASGSLSFRSGNVQVLDPNNNNAPVTYTMVSNVGSGAGQVTPAGTTYAGFSVTNSAPDRVGSTFQLLDGTASHDTNVTATFVAPPAVKAASDTVDLNGTDGDLQVVQIDWDVPKLNFLGPLIYLEVAFLPRSHGTKWVSGVLGNYSGPAPTYFSRAYNPATDFHLGYAGFDTANHKVWAVINHNSLFAAAIPFDLVSVVSRKTHGNAGDFDINLPLTGTRGVECRSGGANGDHTLIFTFKSNLAGGEVSIASGGGSISGSPAMSGNTMTVNLTGVPNGQVTSLTLHNMTDVANQVLDDTTVNIGFLVGDANGDGKVNSADATFTRNRSGQPTDATNFRADYNVSGSINSADATIVRARSGNSLPAATDKSAAIVTHATVQANNE